MATYHKLIHNAQANYSIVEGKIVKSGGTQGSYYISKNDFDDINDHFLINKKIEHYPQGKHRKNDDVYILKEGYKFKLGPGVLWLIGEEFDTEENQFVVSYPHTIDCQPQLNKRVYKALSEYYEGYKWFVELYEKNISYNTLELDFDDNVLVLDIIFESFVLDTPEHVIYDDIPCSKNRIVFGAPGTGKSYTLEKDRKKFFKDRYERVTFHPNYSYSHFVGTYKPVPKKDDDGKPTDNITYQYVPGPFMKAFVEAINSDDPYLLLIEEINRANVTAVFGEVFQLLDRENGISEYEIRVSEDMKDYLDTHIEREHDCYSCGKMKIPNNMYIWATMNSADQGVFPIDTAFKRRWDFEYIGIDLNAKDIMFKFGEGDDEREINWNDLRKAINKRLLDCKINEDKLLGPYFLSKEIIEAEENSNFVKNNDLFLKAFKNKVLMYLYEDVVRQKQHRIKLFKGCDSSTYSSVCNAFDQIGENIFGKDIFSENEEE